MSSAESTGRPRRFPVAICGGRDYSPSPDEMAAFWRLWDRIGATELHHGDCNGDLLRKTGRLVGVDQLVAAEVARLRPQVLVVPHPAEWFPPGWDPKKGPYRPAGPMRNRDMAIVCYALIHFHGDRGTQSCKDVFRRTGRSLHSVLDEIVAADRASRTHLRTQ